MVFRTGHAIGIHSDQEADILIHIGMDTVRLEGRYFTNFVKQGDKVSIGQLITEFDTHSILVEGYDLITPIIVTNTDDYLDIFMAKEKEVDAGELIMTLVHSK